MTWISVRRTVSESTSYSWVIGNAVMDTSTSTLTVGFIILYATNIQCYRCPANHSPVFCYDRPDVTHLFLEWLYGRAASDN